MLFSPDQEDPNATLWLAMNDNGSDDNSGYLTVTFRGYDRELPKDHFLNGQWVAIKV
ncbi:hypothetical protein ABZX75_26530 [Streptomyces sp. NPDC003038]|uniref:hypothetical protein n=1 Tax=unclassified Streptomyces TaxID=2593676 RepID=UPI0033B6A89B